MEWEEKRITAGKGICSYFFPRNLLALAGISEQNSGYMCFPYPQNCLGERKYRWHDLALTVLTKYVL